MIVPFVESAWPVFLILFLQITVVSSLALVASALFRRNAAARKWILTCGLLCILAAPVVTPLIQTTRLSLPIIPRSWANSISIAREPISSLAAHTEPIDQGSVPQAIPDVTVAVTSPVKGIVASEAIETNSNNVEKRHTWSSLFIGLMGIWLAGALVSLIGIARSFWHVRGILKSSKPLVDDATWQVYRELQQASGTRSLPVVAWSPRITAPVTGGVFSPLVLLPQDFSERFSARETRGVLLHEFAHVHGRDQIVLVMQQLAAALFWLHPLVHLLNRNLAQASEEVCDNHALTAMDKKSYGNVLLRLASYASTGPTCPALLGFMCRRWKLEDRIRGILDQQRKTTTRLRSLTAAGVFVLFAGVTTLFATGTVIQETEDIDSSVAEKSPVVEEKPAASDEAVEDEKPTPKSIARPTINPIRIAMSGRSLSAEQAKRLEEQLKQNEDDLTLRTQLLGYYFLSSTRSRSAAVRQTRNQHVLWIIENRPDAEIVGLPFATLSLFRDGQDYWEASELWRKHVDQRGNDVRILGNAAEFFRNGDKDFAESLLKRAKVIEPNNSEWPRQLGRLFKGKSHFQRTAEKKKEAAVRSLECFEEVLKLTRQERRDPSLLVDIAKMAIAAGETKKAEGFATDLLAKSGELPGLAGHSIHHGNLILGRVALERGEVDDAKKYLIAAGKTSGSPTLNSSGPNMKLAKDLLERGEQEIVLEYLDLCAKFWKLDRGRLKEWRALMKAGITPDFGANLIF